MAKVSQLAENGKENAENLSLIINDLQVKSLSVPLGVQRLDVPICICKGIAPTIEKKTTIGELFKLLEVSDSTNIEIAQNLEKAYQSGNKKVYDNLKQALNGFVIGDYKSRKDAECLVYVPLMVLDIDAYPDSLLMSFDLEHLKKNPFVFAAFPSPSRCGLRVLVWADSSITTHKTVYNALQSHFAEYLNITTEKNKTPHLDSTTKNVSRLWFYTGNTELYINTDSQVFIPPSVKDKISETKDDTKTEVPQKKARKTSEKLSDSDKIKACISIAQKRNITPQICGRNNYFYRLACICLEHSITTDSILTDFEQYVEPDFTIQEINKTVESASKRVQFGVYNDAQLLRYIKNDTPPIAEKVQKNGKNTPPSVQDDTTETNDEDEKDYEEFEGKEPKIITIERYLNQRYDVRYNIISNDIEISKQGKNKFEPINQDELHCQLLRTGLNGVEKPLISLLNSKFPIQYDPFKAYFESIKAKYTWKTGDIDYIEYLAKFVKVKDQYFFNTQFKKMLVRVVACAIGKIPFNKQCFTLVGKQNDGKTSFIRFLCPLELTKYIKENLDFDKDARLALCQNLIINLDELASLSKQDANQIKTYFTLETVKDRKPYGKKPETFRRTASFFASTNNTEFLTDETGNVRWLVFEVEGFDFSYRQKVNIDQVWAQAFALLESGFDCMMTAEEIKHSELNNTKHLKSTYEMDLINEYFVPANEKDKKEEIAIFMSSSEIIDEITMQTHRKINAVQIGKAMTMLGFEKEKIWNKVLGNAKRGYWVKKINNIDNQ